MNYEIKYIDIPYEIKFESITDQGYFEGLGSTFGGGPDSYGDIVVEGAFKKSLKRGGRNGTGVAMLWSHDPRYPVGVWQKIAEIKEGLFAAGELLIDTQIGHDTYVRMKKKAIKGLSIGYETVDYEIDKKKKVRYLKEIDLWEISPVVFPANVHAQITTVKDAIENATSERQLESALRELGLSQTASLYIVRLCKDKLNLNSANKNRGSLLQILDTIKKVNAGISKREII